MHPPFSRGALLFELLIGIGILALVITVGAQAVYVSIDSNTRSGERDIATNLIQEAFEGTRSAADSNWINLYGLTKDSQHYYPSVSSGAWTLVAGDQTLTLGTTTFTRYVVISNASRDLTTRDIESTYTLAHDDPGTQKVTATVTWLRGSMTATEYLFRWKNLVCTQTDWTGGVGSGVKSCPDTTYVTDTNITANSSLELCQNGC